jgi:hypothetical protein
MKGTSKDTCSSAFMTSRLCARFRLSPGFTTGGNMFQYGGQQRKVLKKKRKESNSYESQASHDWTKQESSKVSVLDCDLLQKQMITHVKIKSREEASNTTRSTASFPRSKEAGQRTGPFTLFRAYEWRYINVLINALRMVPSGLVGKCIFPHTSFLSWVHIFRSYEGPFRSHHSINQANGSFPCHLLTETLSTAGVSNTQLAGRVRPLNF